MNDVPQNSPAIPAIPRFHLTAFRPFVIVAHGRSVLRDESTFCFCVGYGNEL
jgi:hypothetical protein